MDMNYDLTFWRLSQIDDAIFESAPVEKLIAHFYDNYRFGDVPRKLFWRYFASAMVILNDSPNSAVTEINPEPARNALKNVETAVETILDLLDVSDQSLGQDSLDRRYSKSEAERAQEFVVSQGIRELARNHFQQSLNTGKTPAIDNPVAPFSNSALIEALVSLRTKVAALNNVKNNRKRGPKSLGPLSIFFYCLLDLWHRVAKNSYSRTRVKHEGGEAGKRVAMKSTRTRFVSFCRECLEVSGHEVTESQLSTAIENAIKMYECKKPGISILKVHEISAD